MFKALENGQIIDVLETLTFVKCLPRTKKILRVDEKQANGLMSSNNNEIYHIYGTPYTFADYKKTICFEKIDAEEYNKLTHQLKENEKLEKRVQELEKLLKEIYSKFA